MKKDGILPSQFDCLESPTPRRMLRPTLDSSDPPSVYQALPQQSVCVPPSPFALFSIPLLGDRIDEECG